MILEHRAEGDGVLSRILRQEMQVSSGLMNRLKWEDRILVNGVPQRTNYGVRRGDVVGLMLDEPEPEYPAEDVPLEILYEDDHILAVDKPAGMLIHPSTKRLSGTLANGVAGYYKRTGQRCAFHPVTRLDRDTFGVVLIAKNSHIHALLNQRHLHGELKKTYHGWVWGFPQEDAGVVDAPILRCPLPSLLRRIAPEGKPSVTEYRVLRRYSDTALLELRPLTGRTHQLRLHCTHLGCPILGDPQYGTEASRQVSQALGLEYQRLCAKRLEFLHPITGDAVCVESAMDAVPPQA